MLGLATFGSDVGGINPAHRLLQTSRATTASSHVSQRLALFVQPALPAAPGCQCCQYLATVKLATESTKTLPRRRKTRLFSLLCVYPAGSYTLPRTVRPAPSRTIHGPQLCTAPRWGKVGRQSWAAPAFVSCVTLPPEVSFQLRHSQLRSLTRRSLIATTLLDTQGAKVVA